MLFEQLGPGLKRVLENDIFCSDNIGSRFGELSHTHQPKYSKYIHDLLKILTTN